METLFPAVGLLLKVARAGCFNMAFNYIYYVVIFAQKNISNVMRLH